MCKDYREIRQDITQGRTAEAMEKLDAALAFRPDDATLHYLRATFSASRADGPTPSIVI